MNQSLKILFIGDIFGEPGMLATEKVIPYLKKEYELDFIIAQAENVSGRKGLYPFDYARLKKAGVNAFTLGNHVWSKSEIMQIINEKEIIRPLNINHHYAGHGASIFEIKGQKVAVLSMMGQAFNQLFHPWEEEYANNFFESFDHFQKNATYDFLIIDFHAETTSEKNVFGLYVDGKADAFLGTHTHVQTNDARILPQGTVFMSDVGSCSPINSAIGANFEEVYQKMRYGTFQRFKVAKTLAQFNGIIFELNSKSPHRIIKICNFQPPKIKEIANFLTSPE